MKQILLVDDDQEFVSILTELLLEEGYKVKHANSGRGIDELLQTYRPDVLLLDYRLPGENGSVIAKRLKRISSTAGLPIIVISANHDIGKKVREAGADAFLAKPFEIDKLLEKIKAFTSSGSH